MARTEDPDRINPEHYAGTIQPIDFIMARKLDYCEGNVVKYTSRWKEKNGLEDLMKAKKYLDFLINNLTEGKPRNNNEKMNNIDHCSSCGSSFVTCPLAYETICPGCNCPNME